MINYVGGKAKLGTWIREFIPKDIETYVEPFGGAFWLYFKLDLKKYPNLKNIVYNDFNNLNSNLIQCVVENPLELIKLSKNYIPEDAEVWNGIKEELYHNDSIVYEPDYLLAVKYIYLLTQCWSGVNPFTGRMVKRGGYINKEGVYISKFEIFINKLLDSKWLEKFSKINFIENMDYKDLIDKWDSPTTYFYVDPPYVKLEEYYSNHQFGHNSHKELYDKLKTIKGKFSLSYYDFPELSEWYDKSKFTWLSKVVGKSSGAKKGNGHSKGEEILILNYKL